MRRMLSTGNGINGRATPLCLRPRAFSADTGSPNGRQAGFFQRSPRKSIQQKGQRSSSNEAALPRSPSRENKASQPHRLRFWLIRAEKTNFLRLSGFLIPKLCSSMGLKLQNPKVSVRKCPFHARSQIRYHQQRTRRSSLSLQSVRGLKNLSRRLQMLHAVQRIGTDFVQTEKNLFH